MTFEDQQEKDYFKVIDIYGKRITLRFDGEEYFKTRCGACATIVLALSLIIVFSINAFSIYEGKIASFTYMIRNNFSEEERNQRGKYFGSKFETFGFAFDNSTLLNDTLLSIEAEVAHKNLTKSKMEIFDCAD